MGLDLTSQLLEYIRAIGWALTASIGFSLGVAIAVTIFNKLTGDIDEWEEIKKGNMGVALIEIALIVMIGIIIYRVIQAGDDTIVWGASDIDTGYYRIVVNMIMNP